MGRGARDRDNRVVSWFLRRLVTTRHLSSSAGHKWLVLFVVVAACSDDATTPASPDGTATAGSGTTLSGAADTTSTPSPTATMGSSSSSNGLVDGDSTSTGSAQSESTSTGEALPTIPPAPQPPPPVFPDVVETVSVAVRTSDLDSAGTLTNEIELCLTESDCYPLDIDEVDDFRVGSTDVYHFYDLALPRDAIDRVEIRSTNGPDAWRLACVEVRLDGEPVHCRDEIEEWIGTDPSDTTVWTDPDPLGPGCSTCYDSELTHGPMLGALDNDTARVWVRTDATRRVGLRMGATPDLSDAPVVAWAYPSPEDDFAAQLEVSDLPPDVDWYYDIEIDGALQGRDDPPLRAPASPGTPVQATFAFGSCSRDEIQPIFLALDNLAPDAFFFVGDNHYANSSDLQTVRWHYRRFRGHPPRARFLSHTPTIATWDDHDYTGNNTTGVVPLKANSLRAFTEYWANRSYGDGVTEGVFSRYSYGDIDFFLIDDRYHRALEDGSMLGSAQRTWLINELAASEATFKFIISGSVWSEFGSATDSWAAYLDERDAIFAAIAAQDVSGVVLVSGDIHRSLIRWVDTIDGPSFLELTSSPLATNTSPCSVQPGFEYCYEGNSFIAIDVDTTVADPTLVATVHDEVGTVLWELSTSLAEL